MAKAILTPIVLHVRRTLQIAEVEPPQAASSSAPVDVRRADARLTYALIGR